MHPSLASRSTLCAALAVLALLCACTPGGGADAPATAASAAQDEGLARDLERIERAARAKPAQLELELRARGQGLAAGSAAQLDVLALRGGLAAQARDRGLSEQIGQQLRDWPAGELRAAAVVAAATIGAEYLRAHGDLREARKTLLAVEASQLNAAGLVLRWRYYDQLASISSDSGELDASLTQGHLALRLAEQTGQPWRVALSLVDLAFTSDPADTPARARQLINQALAEAQKDPERVLRDETRKLLLEAQERQDAEQRARDIELLNRDNALKAEQVHQRNLALVLWAALGGCVLVSLGLLWQAFRRVRRTNEALAHSNASLKRQSETDPLTGVANRRHFQAAIKSLSSGEGLAASVFLIDIDHFKRINDGYGHAAGDTVLVDIASRLRQAVRDDDLIVRWGGEEFLVFSPSLPGDDLALMAERILRGIGSEPVETPEGPLRITASIGFASFPLGGAGAQGLRLHWEQAVNWADMVLYKAKAEGRNRGVGITAVEAPNADMLAALLQDFDAACINGQVLLRQLPGPT